MKYIYIVTIFVLVICSCKTDNQTTEDTRTRVEIITTKGNILVELYNETPKHRDNFIKLVEDGFYDSILFHRVINDFIIQTGDPTSKTATPQDTLGWKGIGYNIPSEIIDTIFHKRGSLSAAHDGNPDLHSDGSHFVIIQKGPISGSKFINQSVDSTFRNWENRINKTLAIYHTFHADSNAALYDSIMKAYRDENYSNYMVLYDSVKNMASRIETPEYYQLPKEHKEHYIKKGGAPFNDRIFTVFGEVVTGMDVVDSIAAVKTKENDRPIKDVRIISMRIMKDANKH